MPLRCPDCGAAMVSRLNKEKQQRVWGCSTYPQCKGTRDTDGNSAAERRGERNKYEERLPSTSQGAYGRSRARVRDLFDRTED